MLEIIHNIELAETDASTKKAKAQSKKGARPKVKAKKDTLIKGIKLKLFELHDRAIGFYSTLLRNSIGTLEVLDIGTLEN